MPKKAPITDHALLRYIERVIGIDLEAFKRHICTKSMKAAIKLGAATFQSGGFTYIIENKKVITVHKGKPRSGRGGR